MRRAGWMRLGVVVGLLVGSFGMAGEDPPTRTVVVEGFQGTYPVTPTPSDGWGTDAEEKWILGFRGTLESRKPLGYRKGTLPAGRHDVWTEKGQNDWCYLMVGDREDAEAPRLKALFRLYEQEAGVEELRFDLKLTRRATRLKFSLLAGRSEGHGNFRILDTDPK